MEKIRCFVSINFPKEVIDEIEKIQKELGEKIFFNGKLTEGKNLHLTLKFLGEITEEGIGKIKERLKGVSFGRVEVELGRLGVFFNSRNSLAGSLTSPNFVRIIWVEVLGVDELQKEIDEVLEGMFKPEERFMSHLTIARVKSVRDKKIFFKKLKEIFVDKRKFLINEFELVKSELKPEGPEYEILEKFELI